MKSLCIRHKIMAGTLFICILTAMVGFFTINYVKQISNQVNDLTSNLSRQMTLSREIAAETVQARIHATAYIKSRSQKNLNAFIGHYRTLEQQIRILSPLVKNSARHPLLQSIRTALEAYGRTFSRIVDQTRQQEAVRATGLNRNRFFINNRLSSLRMAITGQDDFNRFLALGNVQMAWMTMHTHAIKFMHNGNERDNVLFQKAFDTVQKELSLLMSLSGHAPGDRKIIQDIRMAVTAFATGFKQIHSITTEINELMRVSFNPMENQMKTAVGEIVTTIEKAYQHHALRSRAMLSKSWHLLFWAIIISLLAGVGVSALIAQRITRPIARLMVASREIADHDLYELTRQLSSLSRGDLGGDFQISARPLKIRLNDEVGRMATAFDDMVHQLGYMEAAFTAMKSYLRQMAKTADTVARGDLAVTHQVISQRDELGNAFSLMVRHLRTSADKVRQYQENLETLVEERTTQLKESNTALKRINQKLTREIEERKDAERALRENKNVLDMALQAAVMGIWQWHPNTGTIILSGEHPAHFNIRENRHYTLDNVLSNYIYPKDREKVAAFLQDILNSKKKDPITYRVEWKDGSRHWMLTHGKPVMDEEGNVTGVVGTTQEITHQVLAEKERDEKKKLSAVMETAGAVCHELNQPLQIISGCCELLVENKDLGERDRKKVTMIQDQIERMTRLNHNLMNITSYKTKAYLTATIIDIDSAAAKNEPKGTPLKKNRPPSI